MDKLKSILQTLEEAVDRDSLNESNKDAKVIKTFITDFLHDERMHGASFDDCIKALEQTLKYYKHLKNKYAVRAAEREERKIQAER